MRIKILLVAIVFFIQTCGKREQLVMVGGGEMAVGAIIYVDGKKVGVMEGRVGSSLSANSANDDIYASANILVLPGLHEFTFESIENKRLTKLIRVKNENYWYVNFHEMKIYDN